MDARGEARAAEYNGRHGCDQHQQRGAARGSASPPLRPRRCRRPRRRSRAASAAEKRLGARAGVPRPAPVPELMVIPASYHACSSGPSRPEPAMSLRRESLAAAHGAAPRSRIRDSRPRRRGRPDPRFTSGGQAGEDAGQLVRKMAELVAASAPGRRPEPRRRASARRTAASGSAMWSSGSTHVPPPTSANRPRAAEPAGEMAKTGGRPPGTRTPCSTCSRPAAVHQQQRVGRTLVPERPPAAHERLYAQLGRRSEPVGVRAHAALVDADDSA